MIKIVEANEGQKISYSVNKNWLNIGDQIMLNLKSREADYDMFVKMIWENNIKTRYIPKVFVTMRSGGASGNGLSAHRQIMRERIACVKEHHLPSNALKQSIRYFEKIASLLKK